jgi:plastocyanin
MTDYAGVDANQPAGTAVVARPGSAAADTVPAGAVVLWINTGAGAHTITLTTSNTQRGLAVADQAIVIGATSAAVSRILNEWGDANGRVAVAISGTATEVTYYVLGSV